MTRHTITTLILFLISINLLAQKNLSSNSETMHKIMYMDSMYMRQHFNHSDIWFLKDKIKDGRWIVFYDSAMKDTAMTANVMNGDIQGKLRIFDRKHHYVSNEWNYVDGRKNGLCYSYIYYYAADGADLEPSDSIYIEIYKQKYIDDIIVGEEIINKSIKFRK